MARSHWLKGNRKWYGVGAGIVALVALTAGLWGTQWITPREREHDHPAIHDKAFRVWAVAGIASAGEERTRTLVRDHRDDIDALVPDWFALAADGSLLGAPEPDLQRLAREQALPLQPLVRLLAPGKDASPATAPFYRAPDAAPAITAAVDKLLAAAETAGATGLHLDLRAVAGADDGRAGDRDDQDDDRWDRDLRTFLRTLRTRMRQRDLELVLHVDAADAPALRPLVDLADAVLLRTFNESGDAGAPGLAMPQAETRAAIDRALAAVQDSKQVLIGLPVADDETIRPQLQYALEWSLGGVAVFNLEHAGDAFWRTVGELTNQGAVSADR